LCDFHKTNFERIYFDNFMGESLQTSILRLKLTDTLNAP